MIILQPSFRPQRVIVAIWFMVAALNVLLSFVGEHPGADTFSMLGTNSCGLCIAVALSFATQHVMREKTRQAWLLLTALVILGGSTVWLVDGTLQFWASLHWVLMRPSLQQFVPIRYNLVYFTLIFALQTSALALLTSNQQLAARERQLAEARIAVQHARLTALQLQLNPHFLFNALNALNTLVGDARSHEAQEMISRLSTFLRSSLAFDSGQYITLERELETVQAYLDIETVRFGDHLQVQFECAPEVAETFVPPFVLQPLLENAVKYAVVPSTDAVTIEIQAKLEGETLILVVADSGPIHPRGVSKHGAGIGLRNLAARIDAIYGSEGRLSYGKQRQGFVATLSLPLRTAGEETV